MWKFQPWVLEYLFCNLQKWLRIISQRDKLWKSPTLAVSHDFISTTIQDKFQNSSLIFCLCRFLAHLHWSRFLPLITRPVIDRHAHHGPPQCPVSTLGGISVLFCWDALAPHQGKGHTWKDSECLSGWRINSHPDCHIQRLQCLSCVSKILVWIVWSVINSALIWKGSNANFKSLDTVLISIYLVTASSCSFKTD